MDLTMLNRIAKALDMRVRTALGSRQVLGSLGRGTVFSLAAKRAPNQLWTGRFNGLNIVMRWQDWPVVEEVLVTHEYKILTECLKGKEAPLVLDFGANIGMFSLYTLMHFPKAQVEAYEASAKTYAVLQENHKANPAYNWVIHHAAVWSEDGSLSFDTTDFAMGGRVVANGGKETVPARSFSALMQALSPRPIDLMKVDIEGAEEAVLAGREAELAQVETLIVELHPGRCDTLRVEATLRAVYPHIYLIPGRTSTKPLLLCSAKPYDLPIYNA